MMLRTRSGFTLIELLVVVAILGIIAAIAIPGLARARISANESSAIGSLRAINSAQSAYAASCAGGGYAVDLADLVLPPSGSASTFISPSLNANAVLKSGYEVNIGPEDGAIAVVPVTTCNGSANEPMSGYFGEAHPVAVGSTGTRSFGTDSRSTIFVDATGAAWTAVAIAAATQNQALQ